MATVLVVDDSATNRDLVRTVLSYQGHDTVEASGGASALAALTHVRPDLVLVDVMMPGMDGYQLARAIRADAAICHLPVVFYTANYLATEANRIAAEVGVTRILAKNGDLTELIETVNDTLSEAS